MAELRQCPECGRNGRQGHAGWCPNRQAPLPLEESARVRIPAKREDYVPPLRFGDASASGRSRSPGSVLLELLLAPITSGVFTTFLLLHGHLFGGILAVIFTIIAVVQAVIYAPRALKALQAVRRERETS